MGTLTYEVALPDHNKTKQQFHVNFLKEWMPPVEPLHTNLFVRAIEEEEEPIEQYVPVEEVSIPMDFDHLAQTQPMPKKKVRSFLGLVG